MKKGLLLSVTLLASASFQNGYAIKDKTVAKTIQYTGKGLGFVAGVTVAYLLGSKIAQKMGYEKG